MYIFLVFVAYHSKSKRRKNTKKWKNSVNVWLVNCRLLLLLLRNDFFYTHVCIIHKHTLTFALIKIDSSFACYVIKQQENAFKSNYSSPSDICLIVILVQWHLSQTGTGFMTSKQNLYSIRFSKSSVRKAASDIKTDQSE